MKIKHECRYCQYWLEEHCVNADSRYCTEAKLGIETCGHWTFFNLRPCPFCGGEAEPITSKKKTKEGKIRVSKGMMCTGCGAKVMKRAIDANVDIIDAVEAWNRREENQW